MTLTLAKNTEPVPEYMKITDSLFLLLIEYLFELIESFDDYRLRRGQRKAAAPVATFSNQAAFSIPLYEAWLDCNAQYNLSMVHRRR